MPEPAPVTIATLSFRIIQRFLLSVSCRDELRACYERGQARELARLPCKPCKAGSQAAAGVHYICESASGDSGRI